MVVSRHRRSGAPRTYSEVHWPSPPRKIDPLRKCLFWRKMHSPFEGFEGFEAVGGPVSWLGCQEENPRRKVPIDQPVCPIRSRSEYRVWPVPAALPNGRDSKNTGEVWRFRVLRVHETRRTIRVGRQLLRHD